MLFITDVVFKFIEQTLFPVIWVLDLVLGIDNPAVTGGCSSPQSAPGTGRQAVPRGRHVTGPTTEAQTKYCGGREQHILT